MGLDDSFCFFFHATCLLKMSMSHFGMRRHVQSGVLL
jgi:hypothetical protein